MSAMDNKVNGSFIIEPPNEDDFVGISQCFQEIYGGHYFHAEVSSATLYWEKVRAGALIPLVARAPTGDIVGHIALEREGGASVAERGEAVVLPQYRGHHLLETMTERLRLEADKNSLVGVFAKPVTVHTFSQRNDDRAGMATCGLMLGVSPESLIPNNMPAPTLGQRQSVVLTFSFYQPPTRRAVFLPAPYGGILEKIYTQLKVDLIQGIKNYTLAAQSSAEVEIDSRNNGLIVFKKIGLDFESVLSRALATFSKASVYSVQLWAPMSDPGLEELVCLARENKFFFCGLGPAFLNGEDILILQMLNCDVALEKLQLFSQQTLDLASFIAKDRLEI